MEILTPNKVKWSARSVVDSILTAFIFMIMRTIASNRVCVIHNKHTFGPRFMAESLFKEFMRLRENFKCQYVLMHMCSISRCIWGFTRKYQSECECELDLCNSTEYSIFILYFILPFSICSTVSISLLHFTLNEKTSFEIYDQRHFMFLPGGRLGMLFNSLNKKHHVSTV